MRTVTVLVAVSLLSLSALAEEQKFDSSDPEYSHELMTGGGISSPSLNPVDQFQNPAGLVYNQRPKAVGASYINHSVFSWDGRMIYSRNNTAASLGVLAQGSGVDSPSIEYLEYGIATKIRELNIAIGVDGTYAFPPENYPYSPRGSADIGLIYNPAGSVRVGTTLFQLVGGLQGMAVGISFDGKLWSPARASTNPDPGPHVLEDSYTFSVDASSDSHLNGITLVPGLTLRGLSNLQCSVAYGIATGQDYVSWLGSGLMVGLGLAVSDTWRVELSANERTLGAYIGLTARL